MKRSFFTAIAAAALLAGSVHSQTPAATTKPRQAVDVLKSLKEKNAALLDRQAKSLKQLDELETTAKTVRAFAAKS